MPTRANSKPRLETAAPTQRDLDAMIELILQVRPGRRSAEWPGAADLHERFPRGGSGGTCALWKDERGKLAAFAYVDAYDNLAFELAPGSTCERSLLEWARNEAMAGRGGLETSRRSDDAERAALLSRMGFERAPDSSIVLTARLPLEPRAALPERWTIAACAGEGDAAAIAAAHRAAFGTECMGAAERLSIMNAPGYERDLDLLARDRSGAIAGTCLCAMVASEPGVGEIETILVMPASRNAGIATALVAEGARRLAKRGAVSARLCTSSSNGAMRRVAARLGFEPGWEIARYVATCPPPPSANGGSARALAI
jgi:ribosomal protein S18 acetylase RimI-like enzyme